ncbi:FtsX-like permease family protein [Bifidobacterium sp. BRDM6]|uniref:FtsX-like permease family protein n=2 Tax=Bifidobacterium choloepi TaxID=2614131 RepID=A0A6I5N017_9BIFI|nr:FtsX-like permease family protein [Bifidobacterium choloepi]NEG69877.1 FtsX-like permease family protein [Bifidobacterium choloepi]
MGSLAPRSRTHAFGKAFALDTLRSWKGAWKQFLSIAVIALLGVAVLTGIYAGCRDCLLAANRYYQQQGLHDLQVLSTLGLTDDDVAALEKVDGVKTVQATRSESVTFAVDGSTKSATLQELGDKGLDEPYVDEGTMPTKAGQVAVTQKFADDTGLTIGDTFTVTPDSSSDSSSDSSDDSSGISTDESSGISFPTTLTITAIVTPPDDLTNSSGYMAKSSFRSTATSDYTFYVPDDGVSGDVYTAISIAVENADMYSTFDDNYDDLVETVANRIENTVENERQQARRQQIVDDATKKLDDAKADAEQQFADAQKQIDDNQTTLDDKKQELADSKQEVEENAATVADGEQQLADGQSQLDSAKQQVADGKTQLADAQAQWESGNEQLTSARSQLDSGMKQVEDGIAQAQSGLDQLDSAISTVKATQSLVAQAQGMLPSNGSGDSDGSDDGETSGTDGSFDDATWARIAPLLQQLGISTSPTPSVSSVRTQLAAMSSQLASQLSSLQSQRATTASTLGDLQSKLADLQAQDKTLKEKEAESASAKQQLDEQSAKLAASEQQIADEQATLDEKSAELASAKQQLEDARQQIADGETELEDAQKQITEAQDELDSKRQEAEDEFAKQQQTIDDIGTATWYVQDRSSLSGFSSLKSDITSIESLGNAFPVVFLIVAVMMSLTTMARLVEEDRGVIGTYLGLGYSGRTLSARYLLFALLACLIGGALGLVAGFVGIPAFLIVVIKGLYVIPDITLQYDWVYGTLGILLFVVGVGIAAAVASMNEVRQMPATLMRPKAPKAGARILLERIRPLWKRLNFLNKVTCRNIFRFKSRLIMTVGGVAGCTALIVCGLAINDTVAALGTSQYLGVDQYSMMVVSSDDDAATTRKTIVSDGKTTEILDARIVSATISSAASHSETVQLTVVPEDELATLNDMIDLKAVDTTSFVDKVESLLSGHGWPKTTVDVGSTVQLGDTGVIVSQSAGQSLGIAAGSTVSLRAEGGSPANADVAAVTRSLIGSDVFISENYYESLFGSSSTSSSSNDSSGSSASADGTTDESSGSSALTWNAIYAKLAGSDDENTAYVNQLKEEASVMTAVSTAQEAEDFKFDLMGAVVALIVCLAGGLALVVLFTLAQTNVSERTREMATLKVLGFYDREVHHYVNREMMELTIAGIVIGLPIGRFIAGLLTSVLNMPGMYFEVRVDWTSYVIAAVATLVFALIVQLFVNPVLDRIDPVSSLKSVE